MASYKNGSITLENVYGKKTYETTIAECGSANEPITITQNGTYTAPEGVGYSPVNVNVPTKEEETKSITITENGTTTVLPTSGKVLSKVDIVANVPQSGGTLKDFFDRTESAKGFFTGKVDYNNTVFYDATNEVFSSLLNYSDTENVKDFSYMFVDCSGITSAPNIDTSNATNMAAMFRSCKNLVDVSQLNITGNTTKSGMFNGCNKLTTLPKTINNSYDDVIDYMFNDCNLLERVDIYCLNSHFADYNRQTFGHCYSLKKLIIRNMNRIPPIYENTFSGCFHFYGTTEATYNPDGLKDGRIYVPDDKVESLKTATNWSVFADIIVPLSTLVEE